MTEENTLLRAQAISLRIKGWTLKEILKVIGKPRGTVWHWIKDVNIPRRVSSKA